MVTIGHKGDNQQRNRLNQLVIQPQQQQIFKTMLPKCSRVCMLMAIMLVIANLSSIEGMPCKAHVIYRTIIKKVPVIKEIKVPVPVYIKHKEHHGHHHHEDHHDKGHHHGHKFGGEGEDFGGF